MESAAENRSHILYRSLSLPSSDVHSTASLQPWGYIGVATDHKPSRFTSHFTTAIERQGGGHTKPQLLRPLPNFGEHFKITGDICRQFLEKLAADVQKGRVSLENRKSFQSAIEAACFLRGSMMASHTKDAQRDVDRGLVQTTWNIIRFRASTIPFTQLTQTDLDQLQAFLIRPPKARSVIEESNDAEAVAENSTAPATPAKSLDHGVPTANTDTSLHTSFTDDQREPFPAMAYGCTDQSQSAFSTVESYQASPHLYPLQFHPHVTNMQFRPGHQAYIGPYIYPKVWQPLSSDYHDETLQYGFPAQIYGGHSLSQPICWNIDPQVGDPFGTSHTPKAPIRDQRNFDTGVAPGVSRDTKGGHSSSSQADQGSKCVRVRTAKRPRRRETTPKSIAPMGSAPAMEWVNDVFVEESPSSILNSPRKRKHVTEGQVETETKPVDYRFQIPANAASIEGKTRDMLLMEGKL